MTELYLCQHRNEDPVGVLKCTCANVPDVYACSLPWNTSGYCTPIKTGKPEEFPPDGPIILFDGKRLTPTESRMKGFVVWPMKPDEQPTDWQVVVCETCPYRLAVDPARLPALEAGVIGADDCGWCATLHLFDRSCWQKRREFVPESGYCLMGTPEAWLGAIATVEAISVVFHVGSLPAATLDAFIEKYPAMPIRVDVHGKHTFQLCFIPVSTEAEKKAT